MLLETAISAHFPVLTCEAWWISHRWLLICVWFQWEVLAPCLSYVSPTRGCETEQRLIYGGQNGDSARFCHSAEFCTGPLWIADHDHWSLICGYRHICGKITVAVQGVTEQHDDFGNQIHYGFFPVNSTSSAYRFCFCRNWVLDCDRNRCTIISVFVHRATVW